MKTFAMNLKNIFLFVEYKPNTIKGGGCKGVQIFDWVQTETLATLLQSIFWPSFEPMLNGIENLLRR